MALAPGTRIGVYQIRSQLGTGGMGEVYRAHDTKLGRDVAIKILPDDFADDPERVARFQREAQVLAALNHPHIAQLYGFEEGPTEGGHLVRALVMELVEGSTLADRIVRGPLPMNEALPMARQIAEALHAAHDKGIIHRDLKPANIALTLDGNVKLLDFGLAKPAGPNEASPVAESPTITSPAMMTNVGTILGTAAYMSPEQAKGRGADKRSDVWAFGCVLYEMLTGSRTFASDSVQETLALVLTKEPDWLALPSEVHAVVRTLLEGCLAKDPRKRVADVSVAEFLLAERNAALLSGQASIGRSVTPTRAPGVGGWPGGGTSQSPVRWRGSICSSRSLTFQAFGFQWLLRPMYRCWRVASTAEPYRRTDGASSFLSLLGPEGRSDWPFERSIQTAFRSCPGLMVPIVRSGHQTADSSVFWPRAS